MPPSADSAPSAEASGDSSISIGAEADAGNASDADPAPDVRATLEGPLEVVLSESCNTNYN